MIETRGEGGLILCAPTPGYELMQGKIEDIATIDIEERDFLMECAWSFDEKKMQENDPPPQEILPFEESEGRPGDEYNRKGDVRVLLRKHGWKKDHAEGINEHWTRPGKERGTSATLRKKDLYFYVFSSNAWPLESDREYKPFSLYAALEHGGDCEAAASQLASEGFESEFNMPLGVDLSGLISTIESPEQRPAEPINPKNTQDAPSLDGNRGPELRIPGFISEVMDYCMETAPYPNQTLAFCGALSLQAHLAGRKVKDIGGNRTNFYLLGLAYSGSGKDWPRKLNTKILHLIGANGSLGENFASAEGIADALYMTPNMLFQTDEIDGLLKAMSATNDMRFEGIMGTLLTMYSSSNSIVPMRRKATKEAPGSIDNPCLNLFGTAIPNNYYEALSDAMMTNGFFARMLIFEGIKRSKGQEPTEIDPPVGILRTAGWWQDWKPTGNLGDLHPNPRTVKPASDAVAEIKSFRDEVDLKYEQCENKNDMIGTTVWARASEHVRKLSLVYAISESHLNPIISKKAVRWSCELILNQIERTLHRAKARAGSPFDKSCIEVSDQIKQAGKTGINKAAILRKFRKPAKEINDILRTLIERETITQTTSKTGRQKGAVFIHI